MCKNITNDFLAKIKRANDTDKLFIKGDKILVGLSGGADSTCLLLSLCDLREQYDLKIYALHVNHMIRGEEADRDEEFCRNLCEKLGINFMCERIDVPSIAKKDGVSLELCARNERYSSFERACKGQDIHLVATAHNRNDNVETTLFNLVRGSGTRGLCGIPKKRRLTDSVTVIRPLLCVSRDEIEGFLKEKNQDFVTDSTNLENDYTRNYLRHEIVPQLKRINGDLEDSVARTNRLHAIDEDYFCIEAQKYDTDDVKTLSKLHMAVLSRIVIKRFGCVSKETLPEHHIKTLCEKIYEAKDTSVSLPDSYSAKIYHGKLKFVKQDRKKQWDNFEFCSVLNEKATFFENSPYALYISFDQSEEIPKNLVNGEIIYKIYTTDYLYFDTIPECLYARNRKNGDKILSCNMNKSIKRLFTSSVFDKDERKRIPLVTYKDKIILIPALAVDDEYKKEQRNKTKVSFSLYIKEQTYRSDVAK